MRGITGLFAFLIPCIILTAIISCGEKTPPGSELAAASRHIAGEFMKELKGELYAALEDSGTVGALRVCAEKAPEMAAKYSSMPGWKIKRASTRYRNPNNAPDDFEKEAFDVFANRTAVAGDEYFVWVEEGGKKTFRFVKAIKIAAPCLGCHGDTEKFSPELKQALAENYPDDNATGYKMGDLRGVLTISISWPEGKAAFDSLKTVM